MNTIKDLELDAERLDGIETYWNSTDIKVTLKNVHLGFLSDIKAEDIVYNHANIKGLFEAIMELDESKEILHNYLKKRSCDFEKELLCKEN